MNPPSFGLALKTRVERASHLARIVPTRPPGKELELRESAEKDALFSGIYA
jgi:hypothetical protein